MTLVNRLIKEAKQKPDHLTINRGQVRRIAAHAHSLMMISDRPSIEFLEEQILAGQMRMCGVPIKVGAA